MAAKIGLTVAATAAALAIGTGGYFANEWRVCRDLEQDYRSFAIGLLADGQVRRAIQSPEFDQLMNQKTNGDVKRAAQTLFELGDRCGDSAATRAQAEAQALVLGIAPS